MSKKNRRRRQGGVNSEGTTTSRSKCRLRAGWLLLAGLLAVLVWPGQGWLAVVPRWQARRALSTRRPENAHQWLSVADYLAWDDPETEFLRARVFRKQGEFGKLREHLKRAQELGFAVDRLQRENWLALAQSGQLRKAEPHLAALLTEPRGDESEICEAFVVGFFRNHRISDALQLLESWIADHPEDPHPRYLRGKIWTEGQKFEQARQDFLRAWELDPTYFAAAYELAEILFAQNRHREAFSYYELCAVGCETKIEAQIGQAKCWKVLDQSGRARNILQDVLAQNPSLTEALFELGQLDLEVSRFAEAVRWLRQAHRQRPHDLAYRYALATALRGAGELKQAQTQFRHLNLAQEALARAQGLTDHVAAKPDDVKSRHEIGQIYLEYGSAEKGVVWLLSVLDYDPQHTPTHEALAAHFESRAHESPEFAKLAQEHRTQATTTQPNPSKTEP